MWLGKGEPLVRFFGLFYAATGLAAFLLQASFGRLILARSVSQARWPATLWS